MQLRLILTLARRELRGGLGRFGVFLACLALGTAVIAGVGSLAESVNSGLSRDAKALLGGDVSVRLSYRPASDEALDFLRSSGEVSTTLSMRSMAGPPQGRAGLVELKAVDASYPLYGEVVLEPAMELAAALEERNDVFGAVADAELFARTGLSVGETIRLGEALFELRARIRREPDRAVSAFTLGPRLMISDDALPATGLMRPGSLVRYHHKVRLAPGSDAAVFAAELEERFPSEPWRVRDYSRSAPGLRRLIDQMTLYLTLVGLTSLIIGGLGVGGAVGGYLAARLRSIAVLKCLGATPGLVLRVYLAQILILGFAGTLLGLALGAAVPFLLSSQIAHLLPVAVTPQLHLPALARAAGFGLLTALAFSLPPLLRAGSVPGAGLFRSYLSPAMQRFSGRSRVVAASAAAALALYTLAVTPDRSTALLFLAGTLTAFGVLLAASLLVRRLSGLLGRTRNPRLALAMRNIRRPGSAAPGVLLSLGLGLTVLTSVALIDANIRAQVRETLPERAPSYFFIDIQPDQTAAFDEAVLGTPGVTSLERMPMLRARITAIDGVPASEVEVDSEVRWALRGDRGLTYAAEPPEGDRITAGSWWPADYAGEPVISLTRDIATGFGIGVGDTLTLNILGREMSVRIANLREVDWSSLEMNFAVIFPPGFLESAPHTHIATVSATPEGEERVLDAVTSRFPNITAVRLKEALETVSGLISAIGTAVAAVAAVTLAAGLLVLAETLRVTLRRRHYEAVILKTVGATRKDILLTLLYENLYLGLAASVLAAALGSLTSWLVTTRLMEFVDWSPRPVTLAATAAGGMLVTLLLGLAGMRRVLNRTPMSVLRNE